MPGPTLALDHCAVPAARSPGPADRGPSGRCGPSSVTQVPQEDAPLSAPTEVHMTQLCGPPAPTELIRSRGGSPSGSRGVPCICLAPCETHRKPARAGVSPSSRAQPGVTHAASLTSRRPPHMHPVPRAASCGQHALWGSQPGSALVTLSGSLPLATPPSIRRLVGM